MSIRLIISLFCMMATVVAQAQSLVFDAEGRLVESRLSNTQRVNYAYDSFGNITQSVVVGIQAETDSEGDGLPDAWEYVFFNNLTNTAAGDPNLNGKNNLWEFQNGRDPLDPDTDADGMANWAEIAAGTDPLNPFSSLELSFSANTNAGFVRWQSVTNKRYSLQRSTNLMTGFSNLRTNILATPALNTYTDSIGAVGSAAYRVRLE
jgi:YD repeat-containing protein